MDTFGGPAHIAFNEAANEAYVADGYRNRRIAVIDVKTGAIKRIFGAYGNKPNDADAGPYDPADPPSDQFRAPVCAAAARDGTLYVCDRQNDRLQLFTKAGSFIKEKILAPKTEGEGSVWDVAFSHDPEQKRISTSPTARTCASTFSTESRWTSSRPSATEGAIRASFSPSTASRRTRRATSTPRKPTKASACRNSRTKERVP